MRNEVYVKTILLKQFLYVCHLCQSYLYFPIPKTSFYLFSLTLSYEKVTADYRSLSCQNQLEVRKTSKIVKSSQLWLKSPGDLPCSRFIQQDVLSSGSSRFHGWCTSTPCLSQVRVQWSPFQQNRHFSLVFDCFTRNVFFESKEKPSGYKSYILQEMLFQISSQVQIKFNRRNKI